MLHTPGTQKKVLLTHLDWNLQRLDEALKKGNTEYFRGVALQRFGHTYTIVVKSIRGFSKLKDEIEENSEEQYLQFALQNGWTVDKEEWQGIIADYQRIKQKVDMLEIESVYNRLPSYLKTFKKLYFQLISLL